MNTPVRVLQSVVLCIPLIAIPSCGIVDRNRAPATNESPIPLEEPQAPRTFLENHRDLKQTRAYRQNIWIGWNHGQDPSRIALCVDLQNQVYLVIAGVPAERDRAELPIFYQNLGVSVPALRARMDPEAFVLDQTDPDHVVILRIPDEPPESFAAEAIHQVLGKRVAPEQLTFQAD